MTARSETNYKDDLERQRYLKETRRGIDASCETRAAEVMRSTERVTSARGERRGQTEPHSPVLYTPHAHLIDRTHEIRAPALMNETKTVEIDAVQQDQSRDPSVTKSRAASVLSHTSSCVILKKQAQLRAFRRHAAIERELIQRELDLELEEIEALGESGKIIAEDDDGSQEAPYDARSPYDDPRMSRVDEWINQADDAKTRETVKTPLAPPRGERALSPPRGPRPVSRAPTPASLFKPIPQRVVKSEVCAQPPSRGYYKREPSPVMSRGASPHESTSQSREKDDSTRDRSSVQAPSDAATAFNKLADQLKEALKPRPPKQVYELPYYHGDPNEWLLFYNAYKETTTRYGFTEYENMARLRNCLRGEAKQCVSHLLSSSNKPDLVIRLLKKNFGRTDLLIDRALEELKKLPALGPSAIDINTFSTKVVNIVSTLIDLDKKNYADNPLLIREITERLSPHLRSRWCAYAKEHIHEEGTCELMLLANFLMEESDAEMEFSHPKATKKTASLRRESPRRSNGSNGARAHWKPSTSPSKKHERTYTIKTQDPCLCCGNNHRSSECKRVKDMTLGERWEWAKANRVCYRCMDKKHPRGGCTAKGCGVTGCPHQHHRLLHKFLEEESAVQQKDRRSPPPPRQAEATHITVQSPAKQETEASEFVNSVNNYSVLLKIVPITIEGPLKRVDTFALMDEGSTVSLADELLMKEIGATGPEAPLRIHGVGGLETSNDTSQRVNIKMRGKNNGPAYDVTVRTVKELGLRGQRMNSGILRFRHMTGLGDACYQQAVPRILLGADNWPLMLPIEAKIGQHNEPAAVKTRLGWVIYGTVPRFLRKECLQEVSLHLREQDQELDEMLKGFFSIDSLGIKNIEKKNPLDLQALDIFQKTCKKIPGPRYEVGQLWRDEKELPPSYNQALVRLKNLERKMDRDAEFANKYTEQIDNLLAKGYAECIQEPPKEGRIYYLPHFAVTNPNKPGKVRLVFDAACTNQGKSLNDFLLEGPDLLQSLFGILFRFREGAFAVTADIAEMFLQIKIRPEDQHTQLFLWRGADRLGQPKVYKMSSMIFGAASSPFLAHSVRNRNAVDNAECFPGAVEDITTNHYMDDYVASYSSEEELINKASQVRQAHQEGGFQLRGWSSNSKKFLATIPADIQTTQVTPLGGKELKILGMYWNPNSDELGFNTGMLRVPAQVRSQERAPTKREMLSAVMSIYDPLGLLSHYTITARVQLQKIWWKKLWWDDPLPDEEHKAFKNWMEALDGVTELRVPRCYLSAGAVANRQLHVFVDASEKAYACMAYWRTQGSKGIRVSLIAAKAKVAPIKQLSVPRLELQSALIGARLRKAIEEHHRIDIHKVYMWSDSKTVLHWVRNNARRYSQYVANRLGEIAELTKMEEWKWVPTKQNPADEATRPDENRKIKYNGVWYQGPEFLWKPEEDWPQEEEQLPEELPEYEERCLLHVKINATPLPDIKRFSNYERLINATGRIFQFIECLKERKKIEFQVHHRKRAELLWFQHTQKRDFPDELRSLEKGEIITKQSRIFAFDPVLDPEGVIRMRGRLNAAPVQGLEKRPIILDAKNDFVKLLILRAHKMAAHANNERVVNDLRQQYWILGLRPAVRMVAHECRLCQLRRARPQVPAMGDLPLARVQPFKRPFTNSGVDLFGPLTVTIGRRHEKRWVALFTCLTTRAVHLEIVHSLSTDSAIMALRRLAARRGWPAVMYSDNATNFRGSDHELRSAFKEWLPALRDYGVQRHMEWRFIAPGAPNQGGAWERLVRSVKTALTATLHSRAPKEEVLITVLAEAENIVNSRPLTHVSTDVKDEEALTPNHFLVGGSTGLPLTGPCEEIDRRAWRASQALADHFWRRWVREYLPTLAPRLSSANHSRPLQTGDVVVVVDSNLPRNVWPRGIVEAIYPGPDGGVRTADVRTKGGVFRRPVTRLAVLPVNQGQLQEQQQGQNVADSEHPGQS